MRGWLKLLFWAVAIGGGVFLVLYETLFDVWRIPVDDPVLSASIEPTLTAGDLIVLSRHGTPGRSELLRCPDPEAPGRYVIARAIARSGENLALDGEIATVDEHRTPSPHACESPTKTMFDPSRNEDIDLTCSIEDYAGTEFTVLRSAAHPVPPMHVTVQPGLWFLLSDNRHLHLDSRDYGQLDTSNCKHIVFRIVGVRGISDSRSRLSIIW
jgi:signal peptidase I